MKNQIVPGATRKHGDEQAAKGHQTDTNAAISLTDQRPELAAQRKLIGLINDSPQVQAGKAIQQKVNGRGATIQRAPAPGSDVDMARMYNDLLANSRMFARLDRQATRGGANPILLEQAAIGENPAYFTDRHAIRVPLWVNATQQRSEDDIRHDIIWEMHNAGKRREHNENLQKVSNLPAPANTQEVEEQKYKKANFALASEWLEWSMVREHVLRVDTINQEMTRSGSTNQSSHRFSRYFNRPDQGWYLFSQYLGAQVANGHTHMYDPTANNNTWVGVEIFNKVPAHHFLITQQEEQTFVRTNAKRLKPKNSNPFSTETYWRQAMNTP